MTQSARGEVPQPRTVGTRTCLRRPRSSPQAEPRSRKTCRIPDDFSTNFYGTAAVLLVHRDHLEREAEGTRGHTRAQVKDDVGLQHVHAGHGVPVTALPSCASQIAAVAEPRWLSPALPALPVPQQPCHRQRVRGSIPPRLTRQAMLRLRCPRPTLRRMWRRMAPLAMALPPRAPHRLHELRSPQTRRVQSAGGLPSGAIRSG